jgi:hypothetical protein
MSTEGAKPLVLRWAKASLFGRPKNATENCRRIRSGTWVALLLVAAQAAASARGASLPARLVLLLDGVSYRDVKALQEGTVLSRDGKLYLQAFQNGYYPASRLVSTFPSISDPAWCEILGKPPPPGYQRTYFNAATGSEVYQNGVTSSADYEKQVTWQMGGSFRRLSNYGSPVRAFRYEVSEAIKSFLQSTGGVASFYALIHSTDSAQHLWGDINSMLCLLDEKLRTLRATYRAREGKELEILILSDHGNNHAGGGKRVAIRSLLARNGYRITKTLARPKDVVLPTAGIETWIEIHNSPSETTNLVQLLSHLDGVGLVTAPLPAQTNRFMVVSSKGEQAVIEWNTKDNSFKYEMKLGDPLGYEPVVAALADNCALDAQGFATADDWAAETLTHHYPVALERIARGHTTVARNPASILVSLNNTHVHSGWFIMRGRVLVKSGGTHGGLDDINSTGVLLSSFTPTSDTSTSRVPELFGAARR